MSWWGSSQRTMGLRTKPRSESEDGRGRHGAGVSAKPAGVSAMLNILTAVRARHGPAGRPVHPHPQPPQFTHRLAIQLGQPRRLRVDDDGTALPVLDYPVTTATA